MKKLTSIIIASLAFVMGSCDSDFEDGLKYGDESANQKEISKYRSIEEVIEIIYS